MKRAVWFTAAVTPDLLLVQDDEEAFRLHLRKYVGLEVLVRVIPMPHPPSSALRGYYFGVLVELFMEEVGYTTKEQAHDAVVRAVLCTAWEKERPSMADDAVTHDEMVEFVERACATFITDQGWVVPDPAKLPPDDEKEIERAERAARRWRE